MLPFSSLSLLLLAVTAAASLEGTYVYCIRDEQQQPAHTHRAAHSLFFLVCVSFSHTPLLETIFLLGWVYLRRQLSC